MIHKSYPQVIFHTDRDWVEKCWSVPLKSRAPKASQMWFFYGSSLLCKDMGLQALRFDVNELWVGGSHRMKEVCGFATASSAHYFCYFAARHMQCARNSCQIWVWNLHWRTADKIILLSVHLIKGKVRHRAFLDSLRHILDGFCLCVYLPNRRTSPNTLFMQEKC